MKAPYFPVETETWMADIEYLEPNPEGIAHGPIEMTYHNVHHPGVTYGYKVRVGGKSVVYVSDNEVQFLKTSIAKRIHEFDETSMSCSSAWYQNNAGPKSKPSRAQTFSFTMRNIRRMTTTKSADGDIRATSIP